MTAVSAQVSLYPLCQEEIGPAISAAIAAFRARGLDVWEGAMSTVIAGDLDAVCAAVRDAFDAAAAGGEAVMVVTLANGCPVPASPPS
jgi:uncharacterized protein YqgV (UPF0045/DUF77 family)